jgi:photosystem II stability/assembly factor-like uncharacterized protein
MRNNLAYYTTLFFLSFYLMPASLSDAGTQEKVWTRAGNGISDLNLQRVEVVTNNPDIAYASSTGSVYKTSDGGNNWKEVLSLRGSGNAVNALAVSPSDKDIIYTGTGDGLFMSSNGGSKWKRIFQKAGGDNSVLAVAVRQGSPDIVYIGTGSGIYFSEHPAGNWKKDRNLPVDSAVNVIAVDPSDSFVVFAALDKGLYKSLDKGITWRRILVTSTANEKITGSDDSEYIDYEKIETDADINSIAIESSGERTVYIGMSKGLLLSRDGGSTWMSASKSGLAGHNIISIVLDPTNTDHIFAATNRGVFRYSKLSDSWKEIYKGLLSRDIRYLSSLTDQGGEQIIWAVTKRGIFKTGHIQHNAHTAVEHIESRDVYSLFEHEPTIAEIREAAIEYAEVQPGKVEKWRKAAAHKAWLPALRVAYDKDRDWKSDKYYYSGKHVDNDITKGRDEAWSISLTWALGDLIYSNAQTSIDSRSRLTVQLREDILIEVTRLYFERRRLQIEIVTDPPEELAEEIEKGLRLQELTANIDGLTGSYLSKRLANAIKLEQEAGGERLFH